jgi:hypothetical protein
MSTKNTPETDAQVFMATPESEDLQEIMDVVTASFARSLEEQRDELRDMLAELYDDAMEADAAIVGFLGGCDAREVRQSFPDFKLASDKLDLSTSRAKALLTRNNDKKEDK